VKAAGIRAFGAEVEFLELPGPRALGPDEVLINVRAVFVAPTAGGWAAWFSFSPRAHSWSRWANASPSNRVPWRWPGSGTPPAGRPSYCGQGTRRSWTISHLTEAGPGMP